MQAVSARATAVPPASATAVPPVRATAIPTVTDALRAVESLLMSSGQRTARRNAWTSVLEDRRHAKDRIEVQRVLDASRSARTS